ncbi:hypothetical protein [Magnetovibrio blakemorei]|uniref:Uncharacterized protein n=1 Tax=Magnetovibrio blakemorei TaxID=28181 RepID=A0A1E5QBD8_9PROT|nr:hypothetical protein [Magnetovibrio blakemorei]OEJ69271.1 hypothetical protein BEN30_04100 [Magnetovibrio blakemorei]
MTTISDITITTDGTKPPANICVTVNCTIDATGNNSTPQVFFPAQSLGTDMTNTPGTQTWTASDTQMYDGEEQTITIICNDVEVSHTFSF